MLLTRAATKCYAFFLLGGVALAEKKKFNVVSFGKSVDVCVNGNAPLKMIQSYPDQPLYHAEVNVDGPLQYQYFEDSVPEAFLRHFPAGRSATFNDFFGREDTVKHLPKLPLPFGKSGLWTRGMGQVSPYNETYIPTVHFTGQNALRFFQRPQEQRPSPDKFSVFFICQDETQLIENVSLSAWKTKLTKYNLRITLDGNDEYYGRNVFKFRFGEADPTFMREKLYTDILQAVGAPVQQTNLVRVYVMGAPVGLYLLQDETSDEKFLKTEFYADRDAPAKMGIPLAADTGADFAWKDPSTARRDPYEGFVAHAQMAGHHNYRSDASNKRVAELARALHNLNPTDEKAVDEFDRKWFDIDIFFKAMVCYKALSKRIDFR